MRVVRYSSSAKRSGKSCKQSNAMNAITNGTHRVASARPDRPVQLLASNGTPHALSLRRIVVPVDFSGPSFEALQYAAKLAAQSGATLHPVYIAEHVVYFDETVTFPGVQVLEELKKKLAELAREQTSAETPVFPHVERGKPWERIVELANEHNADLIVIGTHGRTGLQHFVLGSTAERVVQHAPCPVLVVRPAEKKPGTGL
jgi:universal stress protein A